MSIINNTERRKLFPTQNKSDTGETKTFFAKDKNFLTIAPALPSQVKKIYKRSYSTLNSNVKKHDNISPIEALTLQMQSNGIHLSRTQKEKEKHPDRINLDRRGLTIIPILEDEAKLRLLSLQHNLINNLDGLKSQSFPYLVFLDIYDNQLDKISCLDNLGNLRVLLLGKNRLKVIEGLQKLIKIEVLDLHGNQIQTVSGLSTLKELKVLNLAGNHLKIIGPDDFQGLSSLQELNLRRNRLKKLMGFSETPSLQKLFLSNNEVQTVESMSSIARSTNIRELSIDNNPVFLGGDCVSFLVSYLPNLISLNSMQITEMVRKAAMAWRRNKESSNSTFMDLSSDISLNGRREEVISNARTNWELIRSQTKCLSITLNSTIAKVKKLEPDVDFILTSLSKPENRSARAKLKNVNVTKVPALRNKKIPNRSASQDTDNSQNTSSSNSGNNELFRLPPILVPIINKMEQKHNVSIKEEKLSDSISSIGPNVNSSVSSLNSTRTNSSIEVESSEESEDESEESEEEIVLVEKTVEEEEHYENEKSVESTTELSNINNSQNNNCDATSNLSTNTNLSTVTLRSSDSELNSKVSSKSLRTVKSAANLRMVQAKVISRASTAKIKKISPQPSGCREREQGGDYLIEICGRHLNIYGHGALRFIDKPWSHSKANDVTTINFNYANFNGFSTIFNKVKVRFPNAEHFTFKETNIQYLGQLNALAEIQGMSSLFIGEEGNPISSKNWKKYAIYRLSHWGLKMINGQEITEEDVIVANQEYQSLSDLVLWSLPEPLLQPLLSRLHIDLNQTNTEQRAKQWLIEADPALRSVVSKEALQWKKGIVLQEDIMSRQKARNFCGLLIDQTCQAINKLRLLEKEWPSILQEIVQNTLLDYSQLDIYMKEKISEL